MKRKIPKNIHLKHQCNTWITNCVKLYLRNMFSSQLNKTKKAILINQRNKKQSIFHKSIYTTLIDYLMCGIKSNAGLIK
jgi:hypothetical protein